MGAAACEEIQHYCLFVSVVGALDVLHSGVSCGGARFGVLLSGSFLALPFS
jgi:hypothetical protein